MKRFVIASHHKYAKGFKDTLNFLTTIDDIYDISAYVDENEEPLEDIISELFNTFNENDKVIVLTDMFHGSINQKFIPYMSENVFIVTGANVPLGLELLLAKEDDINYDFIQSKVYESRKNLIFVNSVSLVQDEEDE